MSDQHDRRVQWFTLGHEVGHIVLHPGVFHHRERPHAGMTEPSVPTDPRELEANHFAGCFLVPKKQLRLAFEAAFRVKRLILTDDVAFQLLGDEYAVLMNTPYDSPMFERCVARAVRFRGKHFQSLADLFNVSPTTLGIRLRQVGLIGRW